MVEPDKHNKYAILAYSKAGFLTYKELDSSIVMIASKEKKLIL